MTDWKTRWREADSGLDAGLSDAEIQRIGGLWSRPRARRRAGQRSAWPRAFVVTAALLVMVCASVLTGLQRATRQMERRCAGRPGRHDATPGARG